MLTPEQYTSLFQLAFLEIQNGNVQKAWLYLQTAEDAHCTMGGMHVGFGSCYELYQEFDKALAAFHYAIEVDPSSFAYNNRGRIYLMIGDLEKAMVDFVQTVELQPDNARAHYNMGSVYAQQNKFDQAEHHFKISASQNYPLAHEAIGVLQKQMADKSEANPFISPVKKVADGYGQPLVEALLVLSKFAYATLGCDRRFQPVEKKRFFGLGGKRTVLEDERYWTCNIEELFMVDTKGYQGNQSGVTLEIKQSQRIILRLVPHSHEHYKLLVGTEHQFDGVKNDMFAMNQEKIYFVHLSEVETKIHQLIEDRILNIENLRPTLSRSMTTVEASRQDTESPA